MSNKEFCTGLATRAVKEKPMVRLAALLTVAHILDAWPVFGALQEAGVSREKYDRLLAGYRDRLPSNLALLKQVDADLEEVEHGLTLGIEWAKEIANFADDEDQPQQEAA